MNLLERVKLLEKRAVSADDDDKLRRRSGEFTTLRISLETGARSARQAEVGYRELESAGIPVVGYTQDRAVAVDLVGALISTLENLPVGTKFDAAKAEGRALQTRLEAAQKSIADAWQQHLPPDTPAIDEELLVTLERSGVDVEAIRTDIAGAELTLLRLRNKRFPDSGDCTHLEEARAVLDSIGERIGALIDPAISDIVVRAQNGGVAFSEMTPEIVSALQSLGILGRFQVVLR